MKQLFPTLALLSVLFCGCTAQPTATEETPPSESTSESPADVEPGDSEEATSEAEPSAWLPSPEGIDPQLAQAYEQVVGMAVESNPPAMMNLAMASTQIGFSLPKSADQETLYKFFLQAGKAFRVGKVGVSGIPSETSSTIYFNEAMAHAHFGKVDETMSSIEEAVQNGFSYLNMIKDAPELKAVTESEGFEEAFKRWEGIASEKAKEKALVELEQGETFEFDFAGADIEGNDQSLEALKGKVVIVDIWGTWCPPCRAEIPSFIRLQNEYGEQGFQMIGVNYERPESDEEKLQLVKDFVAENGVNYPCLLGAPETKDQVPDFGGYPTTLFIDRTGKVRMKAVGLHEYGYLSAIVEKLLEE